MTISLELPAPLTLANLARVVRLRPTAKCIYADPSLGEIVRVDDRDVSRFWRTFAGQSGSRRLRQADVRCLLTDALARVPRQKELLPGPIFHYEYSFVGWARMNLDNEQDAEHLYDMLEAWPGLEDAPGLRRFRRRVDRLGLRDSHYRYYDRLRREALAKWAVSHGIKLPDAGVLYDVRGKAD